MKRWPLLLTGSLILACLALSFPRALSPASAQEGQPKKSQADKAKGREGALASSLGAGLALSAYSTQQHLGDLAARVKAGADPSSIRVKAAVAEGMAEAFKKDLSKTMTVLGEEGKGLSSLLELLEAVEKAAAALRAFSEDPSEDKAAAFRRQGKEAWQLQAKVFDWKGEMVERLAPAGLDLEGRK